MEGGSKEGEGRAVVEAIFHPSMPSMWKEGILLVVVVVVVVEGEGEGGVVQVMSPSKNMNPGQPGEGGRSWEGWIV